MNAFFRLLHDLFGFHKLKMLFVLTFTLCFAFLMFPNDDLSDWATGFVSRKTGVYVQVDELGFSILPSPGIEARNVVIENPGFPALRAGSIDAAVSIMKLITGKIGASGSLEKIFGGNVNVDYGQDGKAKSGAPFDEITAKAERVSLDELGDFLGSANILSVRLQGSVKLDVTRLRIDSGFAEQPSGLVNLDIPSLTIPSQKIMVDFNGVMVPQEIPTLELGRVNLKNAKFNEGVLEIPELVIGTPQSDVHGRAKGSMGFAIRKIGAVVQPEVSGVNLSMKLNLSKSFLERHGKTFVGGFLMLVPANLRVDSPKGTEVAINVKIDRLGQQPVITPPVEKF